MNLSEGDSESPGRNATVKIVSEEGDGRDIPSRRTKFIISLCKVTKTLFAKGSSKSRTSLVQVVAKSFVVDDARSVLLWKVTIWNLLVEGHRKERRHE